MASVHTAAVRRDALVLPARPRLLYVDNIRTVLITLVIAGHMAITYGGGGLGDWYYKEAGPASDLFTILALPVAAILRASLLGLFCFIAGYFTPRAYDRKGAGAFLLDRVKRLAIPLVFYEVVIDPVISYIRDIHQGSFQGSFLSFLGMHFSPIKSIATGPVWFLLMLLIFSAGYVAWRLAVAFLRRIRPGREGALRGDIPRAARSTPGNGRAALFAIGLGVLTFVVRIWAPAGVVYEPWHQELAYYPQYICLFAVGILAYRGDWLSIYPAGRARLWLWLMPLIVVSLVGVVAAAGAFGGAFDERIAGGSNWLSLAYSMWEAWTCVAVSIVVLTWFRARYDRQGPLASEMGSCAFPVYVIHPAIIVPLALALSGIAIDLSLKFLLVTPVAIALSYLAAAILRRLPGVRTIV